MKLLCFKSLSEVCRSASVAAAPPPPGGLGGFVFGWVLSMFFFIQLIDL